MYVILTPYVYLLTSKTHSFVRKQVFMSNYWLKYGNKTIFWLWNFEFCQYDIKLKGANILQQVVAHNYYNMSHKF